MDKRYFVYIMMNLSGDVLYVGVTSILLKRYHQHLEATPDSFTGRYHLNRLVYFETFSDVRDAIAREKQIKSWRRVRKEALIRTMNPELRNLGNELLSIAM